MNFRNNIDKVLGFKSDKYLITSLYLKLSPRERENFKYRITLKNLIKEQRDSLNKRGFTKEALESIDSDLKKIADYIWNPAQVTGCRGLVIFSSAREGVWEVFKLPLVYRSRLVVDRSPLIRQLVTMNGEYGFQRMIENEMHQHFKHVSQRLFDYYKENKFDWLIIGGIEQVIADFSNHLHTYLKGKSLGTMAMGINLIKHDELVEKSLDLLEATERKNEKSLAKEFEQKLVLGLAVNGLEATLKALMMGEVRILLLLEGFSHSGFKCPESGVLVLESKDILCPEGKTPIPVVDIVYDVIEEALAQKVEVEMILDEGGKKKIDGNGALVRYKL